jgi:hypothetical protein
MKLEDAYETLMLMDAALSVNRDGIYIFRTVDGSRYSVKGISGDECADLCSGGECQSSGDSLKEALQKEWTKYRPR